MRPPFSKMRVRLQAGDLSAGRPTPAFCTGGSSTGCAAATRASRSARRGPRASVAPKDVRSSDTAGYTRCMGWSGAAATQPSPPHATHRPVWAGDRRLAAGAEGTPRTRPQRLHKGKRQQGADASPGRGGTAFEMGDGAPSRHKMKQVLLEKSHLLFPAFSGWERRPHAHVSCSRPRWPACSSVTLTSTSGPGRPAQVQLRGCCGPGAGAARPCRLTEGGAAQALALPGAPPGGTFSLPRAHALPARPQAPGPDSGPHSPPSSTPAPRTSGTAERAGRCRAVGGDFCQQPEGA
ncbi:uncharacterized protein PS065_020167 [Dugong dugon]